jgi:hypothetical protein
MADTGTPAVNAQPAADNPEMSLLEAILAEVTALAALVVGFVAYGGQAAPLPGTTMIDLELGGKLPRRSVTEPVSAVRHNLLWDLPLIALYGAGLALGVLLFMRVTRSASTQSWAWFGLFAVVATIAADLVEDAALWWAFAGKFPNSADLAFDVASAAAIVKFSAFLPAALVALTGVFLTLGRLVTARRRHTTIGKDEQVPARPLLLEDSEPPDEADDAVRVGGSWARWARAYEVPLCGERRPGIHRHLTGICFSGGGIRAGSVALGAMQSAEFRTQVVPNAQYLVSVSGGGYTSGAFLQALTAAGVPTAPGEEEVETAFLPGTPEEDHVRRHASYLASSPAELVVALGVLGRHLLLSLTVLFGPAVLIGVAIGAFYRGAPVTVLSRVAAAAYGKGAAPPLPSPRPTAWWALAGLSVLAILAWLIAQSAKTRVSSRSWEFVRKTGESGSRMVLRLTIVVATVAVVVPAVVTLSSWVLHRTSGPVGAASPVAAVLLSYGASVASLAWRNRKLVTDKATGLKVPKAAPRGAVQLILVVLTLLVLVLAWLLLVGGMATVGLQGFWTATQRQVDTIVILTVLAVVVVFLGGFSDETTLSLHPFYRKRLAGAFAVRRIRREDDYPVAQPYAAEERTVLSQYGTLPVHGSFPHVILAASATVGEKRTAPGAQRVTYTFCSDWVGGPDLGYVATQRMESLASRRLKRDLTVQGAVALSGAAIAASIGGQRTSWYETLFVVTGLRLGAWMPNPAYLIDTFSKQRPWQKPALPSTRRLSYLLRELFGAHSVSTPLVQVTDGGFYDNLGLVELFRRGCARIYCIDASGDSPPAATTLAQALMLAQEELGVQTDLEAGTWTTFTAGGADPLAPKDPLSKLSARLSQRGIITGTFRYPDKSTHAARGTGVLVVAKASLWPALSYPVLAYAQGQDAFPRDSTGDQFFDDRQYAAYTALGRALGTAAVEAMGRYDENGKLRYPPAGGNGGAPSGIA